MLKNQKNVALSFLSQRETLVFGKVYNFGRGYIISLRMWMRTKEEEDQWYAKLWKMWGF